MSKSLEKLASNLILNWQFDEAITELEKLKSLGKKIDLLTFNLYLYCLNRYASRIVITKSRDEYERNKSNLQKLVIYENPDEEISGEDQERLVNALLGSEHPLIKYLNKLFKEETKRKT